jgi:hypothetical protein
MKATVTLRLLPSEAKLLAEALRQILQFRKMLDDRNNWSFLLHRAPSEKRSPIVHIESK